MATLSPTKKLVFSLILLAVLWLAVELICFGGCGTSKRYKNVEYQPTLVEDLSFKHRSVLGIQLDSDVSYVMFDPELGWSIRPNSHKPLYTSNSKGAAGQPRVRRQAAGGQAAHRRLRRLVHAWRRRAHGRHVRGEARGAGPNTRGDELRHPGSDPGQGLMRYRREGIQYHPAVVLIGHMSENISRMVNTFRPFYFAMSGIPFSKPASPSRAASWC